MTENLMPIFQRRVDEIKEVNPGLTEEESKKMAQISMAAQQFLLESDYKEVADMPREFFEKILQDNELKGLDDRFAVRGLVGAFISDMNDGRIDRQGNIKNPSDLEMMQVMYEPHGTKETKTAQAEKDALVSLHDKLEKRNSQNMSTVMRDRSGPQND